jgi:hypothetical protein
MALIGMVVSKTLPLLQGEREGRRRGHEGALP